MTRSAQSTGRRLVAAGAVAVVIGSALAAPAARAQSAPGDTAAPARLVGTYELHVCADRPATGCGASSAAITGHLILHADTISLAGAPDSASRYLRIGYMWMRDRGRPPNGCFVLAPRPGQEHTRSYAGLRGAGLFSWRARDDGSIAVDLYRSPDAGHSAELTVRGDSLSGVGHSWGFGFESSPERRGPAEAIVGRRVGPPEPDRCVRGAAREASLRW